MRKHRPSLLYGTSGGRLLFGLFLCVLALGGCDSANPSSDAGDVIQPDGDVDGDIVDVTDVVDGDAADVDSEWPPRDGCIGTPTHGVSIGQYQDFFSIPFSSSRSTWVISNDYAVYPGERCNNSEYLDIWLADLYKYDLLLRTEYPVLETPGTQANVSSLDEMVYFTNSFVDDPTLDPPFRGAVHTWQYNSGTGEATLLTTWCDQSTYCNHATVGSSGLLSYLYYSDSGLFPSGFYLVDLNSMEQKLVSQNSPLSYVLNDQGVAYNTTIGGPLYFYRFSSGETETMNQFYCWALSSGWGPYVAWSDTEADATLIFNTITSEVTNIAEVLSLSPEAASSMMPMVMYHNLLAYFGREDIPASADIYEHYLHLYDIETGVSRKITTDFARWYIAGHKTSMNCRWAIISLHYKCPSSSDEIVLLGALDLVSTGIVDEECHVIPGDPLEFTKEEFMEASGVDPNGYAFCGN